MDSLEELDDHLYSLMAEDALYLNDIKCGLNHGINYEDNPDAIDYLCQKFSMNGDKDITLQIPICSECVAALYSKKQLLFICIKCASSKWAWREDSKNTYPENLHVLFFKKCPKCVD